MLPAQMHLPKRHLPKHARARLIVWALAMLMWLGAALSGAIAMQARHQRQRVELRSLTHLVLLVKRLIISRAADFVCLRRTKRHARYRGRTSAKRGLIRAVIGSRLRHTLKRKDVFQQICALVGALRQLDTHAAQLAKRLRRRFTRLAPIFTTPSAATPLTPFESAHTGAIDSS